jgi:hypothetical protein
MENSMVEVVGTDVFSNHRNQSKYRVFPEDMLDEIRLAVEGVPNSIFIEANSGHELRGFDDQIADSLPEYEYEHAPDSGRNPECKIWKDKDFDHSVDLYHPMERIAIEIEKSERKRVSDDLLKFIKGGQTWREKRHRIEFGCIIIPTNYRGRDNIYGGVQTTLNFMRGIMHGEDVAAIGYRDPRWE